MMANLKNKKSNAAKKPAAAAPVQSAAASKDAVKTAEPKVAEVKAPLHASQRAFFH